MPMAARMNMLRVESHDIDRGSDFWRNWCALTRGQPLLAAELVFEVARRSEGEPRIMSAWRDHELVGVLPLVRRGRSLFALRSDHTPSWDYFGEPEGADAIWRALAESDDWDVIRLEGVPAESPLSVHWPQLALRHLDLAVPRAEHRTPYFPLPGFERRLHAKHRQNLRRWRRRAPEVALERITRPSRTDFEQALALEAMAWKGAAGTSIAGDPEVRELYRVMTRLWARRGQLALHFLRLGNQRVAALFAVEDTTRLWALKIGYDPAFAELGPGHLLIEEVARDAAERGLLELDLLGREDEWKRRWTSLGRERVTLTIHRPRAALWFAAREIVKPLIPPRLAQLAREAERRVSRHLCQRGDIVGEHRLLARIRGRLENGLGVRSGLHRLRHPVEVALGKPSQYGPGEWVRVRARDEIRATLDKRDKLRGLGFVPAQWTTCGQVYRVHRSVRRIRDDARRFRAISGTVLLDGVTCDCGGDTLGCGRHCPLFYRDEWLEPAEAAPPQSCGGETLRVKRWRDIERTLDGSGRLDGVTFMPEMSRFSGRRLAVGRKITRVFEYDRWVPTRAPLYALEGAWCTGASLGEDGPCDRGCALVWHRDWLEQP